MCLPSQKGCLNDQGEKIIMKIALFGNPNTGKTSLFNHLTGSYEYVGNWSGVTVQQKVGELKNKKGTIIDLPGIYSLNPLSKDESVATYYLLNESFDSIINIVDASQLMRNLHLTVQLLEFGKPLVIGLNMIDIAKKQGIDIDIKKLSHSLEVPVIPIIARTGEGCDTLIDLSQPDRTNRVKPLQIYYGKELEKAIDTITQMIPDSEVTNKRWLAIQFFEGNKLVKERLKSIIDPATLDKLYKETEEKIKQINNKISLQQLIYQKRQVFISNIVEKVIKKRDHGHNHNETEIIDSIVMHRFLGIPIFLLIMFIIFKLTFDWLGSPLSDGLDAFFSGPLSSSINTLLTMIGASPFIKSLVLEGIIAGVGGVLVFVPQIFILFFFISLIEDSGYMARVAAVMDRIMEKLGLNGKSIIPLIIGFGCNVPGVMAARTIEQPKERLLTILLNPLMSCSARLPIYSLFVGALFVEHQAIVVLSLYVLGIIIALILAKLFSSTILKREESMFVFELPPYRFPQPKSLIRNTWEKGKSFVKKAGTFIFGGTVLIWLLSYTGPEGIDVAIDQSYLALIGSAIAPIFTPLGFGTWQAGASLITGLLAKEIIVSTMNIIYFVPEGETLQGLVSGSFTPLQAYSFMAFVLLYLPCISTIAVIKKEVGSRYWTIFATTYSLLIAYFVSLIIYQFGQFMGFL